jgi:lauroyl/myristoyl acyltransferase
VNVRGAGLRKLAYAGARYGPPWLVKYSPALFGVAFACALPEQRRGVRANLRRLKGPRSALTEHADVFRTFVAYAHCFAESIAGDRREARTSEPVVRGREHLERVLAEGRGAVLVTAHTGSWDAAASLLARDYHADVLVVMAPEKDAAARAVSDRVRTRSGIRVAHVGDHALDALPLLGHLKRGGLVAVQLDRAVNPQSAIDVRLGGLPFLVPRGPFHLAKVSQAPLVPVFARRLGYFRYEVTVLAPIRVEGKAGQQALAAAASAATRAMEEYVVQHPTQWFHFSG